MAQSMEIRGKGHIQDPASEREQLLLDEIKHLKNQLKNLEERAVKCREERDKLKKMLITYDETFCSLYRSKGKILQNNPEACSMKAPNKTRTCNTSVQVTQTDKTPAASKHSVRPWKHTCKRGMQMSCQTFISKSNIKPQR